MFQLSLRNTLYAVIALLVVTPVVQMAATLIAQDSVTTHQRAVSTNWLPSISAIDDVGISATTHQANVDRYVLSANPQLKATALADMAKSSDKVKNAIRNYEPLISSSEETQLFQKFKTAWAEYRAAEEDAIQADKSGDRAKAEAILGNIAQASMTAGIAALTAASEINDRGVGAEIAASNTAMDRQKIVLGITLTLSLAVGICAFLIVKTRAIAPIRGITLAMRNLADGHLETTVSHAGRHDEIGQMAAAVQVFKDNAVRVKALEEEEKRLAAERLRRAQNMVEVVGEVGEVVRRAADGDFSARLQTASDDPEMATLVDGINEINRVVDEATGEFAHVLGSLAQGDLTQMIRTPYRGRFGELSTALNDTVERLAETVLTIQMTSRDVSAAAQEINSGANDLSSRTEQQASSLEETAATTEELAASVKSSATSSRSAVDLAEENMKVARDGGYIVGQAVEAMGRIESASQKISDITGVIDEIAFQTNLLALNAAVEAARAGDAGKGFAVVASEVRTLAQRSSQAAKEITTLINDSVTEVSHGVKLVHSAGDVLGKIVMASQKVTATIAAISAASGEQANGIDEMSQAVAHMDQMTQQNASLAEESAASAVSLSTQINRLNDLVAAFKVNEAVANPLSEPLLLRASIAKAFSESARTSHIMERVSHRAVRTGT